MTEALKKARDADELDAEVNQNKAELPKKPERRPRFEDSSNELDKESKRLDEQRSEHDQSLKRARNSNELNIEVNQEKAELPKRPKKRARFDNLSEFDKGSEILDEQSVLEEGSQIDRPREETNKPNDWSITTERPLEGTPNNGINKKSEEISAFSPSIRQLSKDSRAKRLISRPPSLLQLKGLREEL